MMEAKIIDPKQKILVHRHYLKMLINCLFLSFDHPSVIDTQEKIRNLEKEIAKNNEQRPSSNG